MNNIKLLRELSGIKQRAFADAIGVSQAAVSWWERGEKSPTVETAIQIARYFSVSVGCVVGAEPVPDNYPDHIAPVPYNEVINPVKKAAKPVQSFKPTKKAAPFTAEQTAYLEAMEDRIVEKVAATLREDSSLLKERNV